MAFNPQRSARLRFLNPWFEEPEFVQERLAKQTRLSAAEKQDLKLVQDLLLGTVQLDIGKYTTGRSPPGATDCWLLAYGQVKDAIVMTDDLGNAYPGGVSTALGRDGAASA